MDIDFPVNRIAKEKGTHLCIDEYSTNAEQCLKGYYCLANSINSTQCQELTFATCSDYFMNCQVSNL